MRKTPVTKAEAEKAGKKSKKAALACSIEKWEYVAICPKKEAIDMCLCSDTCALCQMYNIPGDEGGCINCPLVKVSDCFNDNGYYQVHWLCWNNLAEHPTTTNFRRYRKTARAMLACLVKIWNELYPKEKICSK